MLSFYRIYTGNFAQNSFKFELIIGNMCNLISNCEKFTLPIESLKKYRKKFFWILGKYVHKPLF